ncbi:MAG TPA: hypothetical protein DCO72_01460 [Ruminococcus sp.]|nr:hypothetical protein [Ruminococcus sp.]
MILDKFSGCRNIDAEKIFYLEGEEKMAELNFDTFDMYEFEYQGNQIVVENNELKATMELKINGEVKDTAKGIQAATGIAKLEGKLPTGEIVVAKIQKIKLGDSECKVTVNGAPLALKDSCHGKKDLVEGAADAAKGAVDKVKGAVKKD